MNRESESEIECESESAREQSRVETEKGSRGRKIAVRERSEGEVG